MVTSLAPQPKTQTLSPITLAGVTWQTFKQLFTEMGEAPNYGIRYAQQTLEICPLPTSSQPGAATPPAPVITLHSISWPTYQALMADVGDGRAWRMAYCEGVLEIRMPLQAHEVPKELLVDFITVLVDELGLELMKLGSLTLERPELSRAIEPDACFYIQTEALVRNREINLQTDPPPDLAIESDYTNSSLNKHGIYAALGVPELWRYQKNQLEVYRLVNGAYELTAQSLTFPILPIAEIPTFIAASQEIGQRAAVRRFRDRIREILATG
jgi:Uma2 family endonuclease